MKTILNALLTIAAILSISLAASAQDPSATIDGAELLKSAERLKVIAENAFHYEGEGAVYAGKKAAKLVESLPGNRAWRLELSDEATTFVFSKERLSQGMTVREWMNVMGAFFEAAYEGPFRALAYQELVEKAKDPVRKAEASGIEANFLSRFLWLLSDRDQVWDIARTLAKQHKSTDTAMAVEFLTVLNTFFHNDLSDLNLETFAKDRGGLGFQNLIAQGNALLIAEVEQRKHEAQAFVDLQTKPVKSKSASVAEIIAKVSANDREGVAKLLERDLPWEKMTFDESTAYLRMIESIRHPDQSKLVYLARGTKPELDGNAEKVGVVAKLLKKPEWQTEPFAEVLDAYRQEWMGSTVNRKTDFVFPQFLNLAESHSHSSNGKHPSSYISTTTSGPVTTKFAKGGMKLVLAIDERRLLPNFESLMYFEREVLVPLFVFPDEVMGELKKDPNGKAMVVTRADGTVNEVANKIYKEKMSKDKLALEYLFGLWRSSLANMYPDARPDIQRATSIAKESESSGRAERCAAGAKGF